MEYTLPSGEKVKFLDDDATYLGTQLECEFGGGRCFGIAANMDFLLVCTYEKDGEKKYSTDIIAEKVTFLTSKKTDE